MSMASWEYLFEEKILDRGYYITDDVKVLNKSSREVNAIVSGTFDYDVKIIFDSDSDVDSMSCTCPYFEIDNCKHLAALLYYLEENKVDFEDDDIEELFNSVDDENLKSFLLNELSANYELRNKFRLEFDFNVNKDYYKSLLDKIIYADDFSYHLSSFIKDEVNLLFNKKEYNLILELMDDALYCVCEKLDNHYDNYSYESNLDEIIDVISKLKDINAFENVFDWLVDNVRYNFDKYWIDEFVPILFDNFNSKYHLEEKYELTEYILTKTDSYSREKYILYKIQLMNDLNCPESEIDEFKLKNINYPKVQQQFISQAIDEKDYEKAIQLLKKAILNSQYGKKNFQIQLKELYLKINARGNYKKELYKLIIEYNEIDDYKEFKKQFNSDEWTDIREEIFESCSNNRNFLNECYAFEKLNDRLINNIDHEYELYQYKNLLSKDYSSQLLEKYSEIVNQMVIKSGSRKHYQKIADLLNEMITIPNGKNTVLKILDEWKIKYKNRPAMWDELKKVKKI